MTIRILIFQNKAGITKENVHFFFTSVLNCLKKCIIWHKVFDKEASNMIEHKTRVNYVPI